MVLGCMVALYRQFARVITGTTTITLEGAYVKPGTVLELEHLSILDVTTLAKELRIGWQDGQGVTHWIKKTLSQSGHREFDCHLDGKLILVENERPIAQVVTPANLDEVHWHAYGHVYELKE